MPDKIIFYTVVILMTIGVVFSYSLTPFLMLRFHSGEFNFVIKQMLFAIISIIIIWILARLNPKEWLHKIGMTLFFGGLLLMISMSFLPTSIVPVIGGASRWISIFGISIAPVEFFKIGFIYFISWSMSRKVPVQHKLTNELSIFLPYLAVFLIAVFFITILQKDLGQSVVLGFSLIILSYLAGGSGKFLGKVIGFLIFVLLLTIITFSHRTERIQSWWQLVKTWLPDWVINSMGMTGGTEPYQISQALGSIFNGGMWGVGLGNGVFKYGFLAEVHTDFVLEGIAEELGLFAILIIFTLFLILIQRIFRVANRAFEENRTYFLFNVGVALLIALALLINTYGSTGILPMKGIPVPFLSYGGSSIVALSFGIGMVLMTSKEVLEEKNNSINSTEQFNKAKIEEYLQPEEPMSLQQEPHHNNHLYSTYKREF